MGRGNNGLIVMGLRASYGKREVLHGVSFNLNSGVGCLLGPNGAGKSTLLKCLAGVMRPSAGGVRLQGVDLIRTEFKRRARLVSYVPQEINARFPYTTFDVVLMGRNPHVNVLIGPGREDEEATWRALELLGIAELADRPFTKLSGGQRRLVMVARAIAQGGRLMILDEPTSFLDFRNQFLVLSVVRKIAERFKKIVLLSLHDPNQAMRFCDVIFLLKGGKLIAGGTADEVLTVKNLNGLYGMKSKLVAVDGTKFVVPVVVPLRTFNG